MAEKFEKDLIFENEAGTVKVIYKTNLLDVTGDDKFTVMFIEGLDDAEVIAGFNFRELVYTLAEFKTFATNNGLKLSYISTGDSVTTLIDFPASS